MQIRPGGEKLSDTKVGEFDRRPLLFRLSAMQPMQQALPPIITDSVIRTTAACWRWNRLPSCAEQNKKERENSTFSISEEARAFFPPPVVVRKWTNGYQCSEGKSPISPPGFPSWYYFLCTRQEMKFLCAPYHLASTTPPNLLYLFIRISFAEGEKKEPPLHLQTEKSSRAITCHTHQGWYTRQ